MIEIELFGSTTTSGNEFLLNIQKENTSFKIYPYARSKQNYFNLDLQKPKEYKSKIIGKKGFWISFAPIWQLSFFLDWIYKHKIEYLSNLKGLVICSSTSILTKRYSFNQFDQRLVSDLYESENTISAIAKDLKMPLTIIRPTMIYGNSGKYRDNNFSIIKRILRYSLFIPIPRSSGLRQPIHCSQLSKVVILSLNKIIYENKNSIDSFKIINVGGDEELSYFKLIKRIQKSLPKKDFGKYCFIIKVPDVLFFLLGMITLFKSSKLFESILRINTNMSNFEPSYKLIGGIKRKIPIQNI